MDVLLQLIRPRAAADAADAAAEGLSSEARSAAGPETEPWVFRSEAFFEDVAELLPRATAFR